MQYDPNTSPQQLMPFIGCLQGCHIITNLAKIIADDETPRRSHNYLAQQALTIGAHHAARWRIRIILNYGLLALQHKTFGDELERNALQKLEARRAQIDQVLLRWCILCEFAGSVWRKCGCAKPGRNCESARFFSWTLGRR